MLKRTFEIFANHKYILHMTPRDRHRAGLARKQIPGSGVRFWKFRAPGRARARVPGSGIPASPGFFQEYI